MRITGIDHLVLTVADVELSLAWYSRVLGMRPVTFGRDRRAVAFGKQKLNLHEAGAELDPHAARPTPGSADLCLLSDLGLDEVQRHLERHGVPVERGPVERAGATGPITSVYVRDPDGNLIEISEAGDPREFGCGVRIPGKPGVRSD